MFEAEIVAQKQKKSKFSNKEYIKEMQYISLIVAIKLNNIYTIFYFIVFYYIN